MPTSADRTRRRPRARERRTATHRPTGAANVTVCDEDGGALIRLRTSGAATPAATTPQAVALIAFDSRTAPGVYGRARAAVRDLGLSRHLAPARIDDAATNAPMTRLAVVRLGMPLHAEHEPAIGRAGGRAIQLDRLGQVVQRREAAHAQALPQPVDALVVMGLGGVFELARGARGERALAQAHLVVGAVEGAGHAAMLVVAEALGQMLQQGAAAGDVDQLHAPADAEHRQVPLDRRRASSAISNASRSGTVSTVSAWLVCAV